MIEIPNVDLFLAESAIGGALVTLVTGVLKRWVQSDAARLAVALMLSVVAGIAWVAWYAFVVSGAAFQWSAVMTYSVPIYASAAAIFGSLRSARKAKENVVR